MTLKTYAAIAAAGLGGLYAFLWRDRFAALLIFAVIVSVGFFAPTYFAMKRRLENRIWIAVFNVLCWPIAAIMAATGKPESQQMA